MLLELGCPLVMKVIAPMHILSASWGGGSAYLHGLDCYQDQCNIDSVVLVLF